MAELISFIGFSWAIFESRESMALSEWSFESHFSES